MADITEPRRRDQIKAGTGFDLGADLGGGGGLIVAIAGRGVPLTVVKVLPPTAMAPPEPESEATV